MSKPRLLLFPGLGADGRIFEPQRALPLDLELVTWIEPESAEETLGHYAARLAAAIGPRPDSWVGGVSLGAMVALEAASILKARGVIAIGGCSSHRQISTGFRAVLHAGAAMPVAAIRPAMSLAPLALWMFERLTRDHNRLMSRMLREHSPLQISWSCRAILGWECCQSPPDMPVHCIHGQRDEIIPIRNLPACQAVPGGRHLINLGHVEEVNRFILKCVS